MIREPHERHAVGPGFPGIHHGVVIAMFANFAAAALITLGIFFAVVGFFAGGEMPFVILGLVAIFAGGLLGLLERRLAA